MSLSMKDRALLVRLFYKIGVCELTNSFKEILVNKWYAKRLWSDDCTGNFRSLDMPVSTVQYSVLLSMQNYSCSVVASN